MVMWQTFLFRKHAVPYGEGKKIGGTCKSTFGSGRWNRALKTVFTHAAEHFKSSGVFEKPPPSLLHNPSSVILPIGAVNAVIASAHAGGVSGSIGGLGGGHIQTLNGKIICPLCGVACRGAVGLSTHSEKAHRYILVYARVTSAHPVCPVCLKDFGNGIRLKAHYAGRKLKRQCRKLLIINPPREQVDKGGGLVSGEGLFPGSSFLWVSLLSLFSPLL